MGHKLNCAGFGVTASVLAGAFAFAVPVPAWAVVSPTISFETSVEYPVAQFQAVSLVKGDLNNDGKIDLVNGIRQGGANGYVGVTLGDGDGTFTPLAPEATPNNLTRGVAVADFNGDGFQDVVAGSSPGSDLPVIDILWGDGTGALPTQDSISITGGTRTDAVGAGDVNDDGRQDIVVAGNAGTVSVLTNGGGGTFAEATYPISGNASSIALSDLDRDGDLDIVQVSPNVNVVNVLVNDGSGIFGSATPLTTPGNPSGLALGDLNGDGFPDLVVATAVSQIFLNQGDGTFGSPAALVGGLTANAVAIGDLNGDGYNDLAFGLYGSSVGVFQGNGNGTFEAEQLFAAGTYNNDVVIGDFNGDGMPDVASAIYTANAVFINNTDWAEPVTATLEPTTDVVAGSTLIKITGSNLKGITRLKVGETVVTDFVVNEAGTEITFIAPPGTGRMTVTVTTAGGTATAGTMTYRSTGPVPTVKQMQTAACAKLPKLVPNPGTKVILKKTCKTNAGKAVNVTLVVNSCKVLRGDVLYARIIKGPNGKRSVRTYGYTTCIRLALKAPGNASFSRCPRARLTSSRRTSPSLIALPNSERSQATSASY